MDNTQTTVNRSKKIFSILALINFIFISIIQKNVYWEINIFLVAIIILVYCILLFAVALIPSSIYFVIRNRKRTKWGKGVVVMLVSTLITSLGVLGTFANSPFESIASSVFLLYVIALIVLIVLDKGKNEGLSSPKH